MKKSYGVSLSRNEMKHVVGGGNPAPCSLRCDPPYSSISCATQTGSCLAWRSNGSQYIQCGTIITQCAAT